MKKISIIILIISLSFIAYISAEENKSEEYIIQKTDTLWDISGSKLQDNFLWPKLWNVNPHISNPDLIYPGEKIIIPSREELMKLETPHVKIKVQPTDELKKTETKRIPVQIKSATDASAQNKYLIDKNIYISIGWIADELPSIGKIISTPSGHEIAGTIDTVYINISSEKLLSNNGYQGKPSLVVSLDDISNNRFFAVRDIKKVKHPATGKILGHLIRVTGILEIVGIDNNTPKAKIIRSFEEVHVGDSLIPYKEMDPPFVPDMIRTPKINGYVVESLFTHEISGAGDIVFLDRGGQDGLLAGDVFSVFSSSPVERAIGKIQVISLQAATSAAIILNSDEELVPGLKIGQK